MAVMTPDQIEYMIEKSEKGVPMTQIAKELGVKYTSALKVRQEIIEGKQMSKEKWEKWFKKEWENMREAAHPQKEEEPICGWKSAMMNNFLRSSRA